MEKEALLRYCFLSSVMLGAAGGAALNKLKSVEYRSEIFWKLINSSPGVGLAQHQAPPSSGGRRGEDMLETQRLTPSGWKGVGSNIPPL